MVKCQRCGRLLYRGLSHECKTVWETLQELNARLASLGKAA